MKTQPNVTTSELEVLKVLWAEGPRTVRDLLGVLGPRQRKWAYTTVQTLLQRLQKKGYVISEKSKPAHLYRPAVSRNQLVSQRLCQLAEELCDGISTPIVQALVKDHLLDHEEVAELRRMLDDLEAKLQKREAER